MKRRVAAAILAGATLVSPAAASAKVTELGELGQDVRGSCPENCQALTRTTGYQAKVGPDRTLYRAPSNGRIVGWSVALGKPGPKQVSYFQERYGGTAQAALVVLDPGKKLSQRVVAKAPLKKLTPYFGQNVQFPLARTLRIRKGQYIALTVPTWAPTLQIGLGSDTSWRSSRAASGCLDLTTQFAMLGKRTSAIFRCLYRTARLTYSATFLSDPQGTPSRR
ncbi:MAG: hypothetical protein QOI73_2960 [Solirubrobacteraceae bacterium]|nr:hypothetical protein [Solirubrobacteraceae bacterium]